MATPQDWNRAIEDYNIRIGMDTREYQRGAERIKNANDRMRNSFDRMQRNLFNPNRVPISNLGLGGMMAGPTGVRQQLGAHFAGVAAGQAAIQQRNSRGWFWNPGRHAQHPAGRTVTALPSGAGAIGGLLGGQRLGGLADLGVVGGLLPETLGAPVAAGAIGLIGAGIALGKFTSATIEAGKALGTKESIGLGYASFQLRKQMTLMFAEIGQFYLPVLRGLVEATTSAIRWMRDIIPGEDILHQGRSAMATGYDSEGRRTSYRIPRPTRNTNEVSQTHLQHRRSLLGVRARVRNPLTGEMEIAPDSQQPERMPWYEKLVYLLAGSGGGHAQGLQHGGIVHPRPGGVITRVAEAGQPEAIMPMNILGRMVSNQEQNWNNQQEMADAMQSALQRSQDLPPLHQQLADETAAAAASVTVTWPPVNVLNWIPSGTTVPPTGAYAVF